MLCPNSYRWDTFLDILDKLQQVGDMRQFVCRKDQQSVDMLRQGADMLRQEADMLQQEALVGKVPVGLRKPQRQEDILLEREHSQAELAVRLDKLLEQKGMLLERCLALQLVLVSMAVADPCFL